MKCASRVQDCTRFRHLSNTTPSGLGCLLLVEICLRLFVKERLFVMDSFSWLFSVSQGLAWSPLSPAPSFHIASLPLHWFVVTKSTLIPPFSPQIMEAGEIVFLWMTDLIGWTRYSVCCGIWLQYWIRSSLTLDTQVIGWETVGAQDFIFIRSLSLLSSLQPNCNPSAAP